MRKSALACGLLATVAVSSQAFANDSVIKATSDPNNWAIQMGSYNGWRHSKLDQINTQNVASIKVAWQFSTGVLRGHEGAPIVVGDTMWLHSAFPNNVFALNLADENKIIWKYSPKQDPSVIPVMCCDTVNRGVYWADGTIFLGQADTTLVALDAKSGKEKWKQVNADPKKGETHTGFLLPVKDKVIMGVSGAEFGVRCHVTAYAMADGKRLWRAYSMGPDSDILMDPEKTISLGKPVGKDSSLKTWTGDQWKIGGGSTWGYTSFDPELNLFYYGSGNPSTWNPAQRAGPDGKQIDQKWSMTYFARNPDTGMATWAYQMTPFDEWDYDGINESVLFEAGGKKLLAHFDRNGFGYTLDRTNGDLIVAKPYDQDLNWSTGVEMDKSKPNYGRPTVVASKSTFLNGQDVNSKNICPAALGFKDQQPVSYSPLTGLVYIPVNNVCMDYEPFKVSYTPGQPYVGATLSMFPPEGKSNTGHFTMWDPVKGEIVAQHDEPFSVWSGVLTTAGGIACHGTLEGYIKCRDQKDGKELFKHRLPSGSIGNVMTYAHGGKQYIGLFSGVGGWAGIGLAAGLDKPTDGLGAVGNYAGLRAYTDLGGTLTVYSLP
jgi:PQQ-dependent dehydrogenase (methanol/ethanol family)